jgi:group I intron endonuclease
VNNNNNNNNFYVYALYAPNEEDPFWIGKGHGDRAYDSATLSGSGNSIYKKRTINKILESGGKVEIDFVDWDLLEEQAFKVEIETIAYYGRKNNNTGCLTNLTDGGEGPTGHIHTEEHKQKISNSMKGIIRTKEHQDNLTKSQIGKIIPEEVRNKISHTSISRESNKGSNNGFFGKTHSIETVENMKNRKHTDETKDKMRSKKEIKVSIDGIVYDSFIKAAEIFKVSDSTIARRAKNPNFPNYYLLG